MTVFFLAIGYAVIAMTILSWWATRLSRTITDSLARDLANYKASDLADLLPRPPSRRHTFAIRSLLVALGAAMVCVATLRLGAGAWPYMALAAALFMLASVDLDTHLLPPDGVDLLLAAGVLVALDGVGSVTLNDAILGASFMWLCWWLPNKVWPLFYDTPSFLGEGDVRLLVAVGAWVGADQTLLVSMLSLVLAALYRLALNLQRTPRSSYLPFGPPVAGAVYLTLICMFTR